MLDGKDQMFGVEELRQLQESVLHVDFSSEEMEFVCGMIRAVKGGDRLSNGDLSQQIMSLMKHQETKIDRICSLAKESIKKPGKKIARSLLEVRSEKDIRAFLEDAAAGSLSPTPHFLGLDLTPLPKQFPPSPSISSLLRERETWGMAPFRVGRCKQPFGVEFSNHLEDSIIPQSEWTDCCGDISDVSWTSDGAFICGATAHSDYHNMQYNKPGNLLVGSATLDTLKSIPDHRIVRPIVGREENAENALESMRQTQDPWLYTSVVSTAHSEVSGYTFTASFDGTVKVWKVSEDGSSMTLCGTWEHDGKVNFVKTSEHHERVATASDVSSSAIRVYNLDESSIPSSPYDTYDCDRALAQAQEPRRKDTWAYFPATIAWGRSPSVEMFLLVGYSPRSLTPHESDIPEDKRNSGEICLWNVEDGERVLISASKTQNVFEVMWHPTQPIFLAATSPSGIYEAQTRTQIRLFGQNEVTGTFTQIKVLDCEASDINELTVM
jgi:WD40 repeat protein